MIKERSPDELTNYGHFVNGASSMTLALVATQPATTLKTFSQSNQRFKFKNMGPLTTTKRLWSGFLPNALSGASAESIAFVTYNVGKKSLQDEKGNLSTGRNFLISSVAGVLGSPANSTLEQLMIRQQLYKGRLRTHLKEIYQKNGLKGVFKGSSVTAGRDMGFNIGVFALNDLAKETLKPVIKDPLLHETFSGLLAGSVAGFITNPLDRAKTMMHADRGDKYRTFRQTAKKIVKTEGVRGLFKGGVARTGTIGSLVCASAMLKERVPHFLPNSLKVKGDEADGMRNK